MPQERIGRYRILGEIAAGTQGAVSRAFDPDANRLVAVKVLHPSFTGNATNVERFHREASLAASIAHPNIIEIYEVGEDDGRHFMAMEFLPESLARVIEAGGLSVEAAAEYAAQIGDGLGTAHAAGIVHRDIKPQNILITPDGTPKVTDFGIARAESLSTVTATGMMMGTTYYMSPEQARGERADARSDVYSLGCVLYQMLAGVVPFEGTNPLAVLRQHIDDVPRPVGTLRQDTPRALAAIVGRAMAKDASTRFVDAADMAEAIRAAVPGIVAAPGAALREEAERRPTPPPPAPPPAPPRTWFGRRARRGFAYTVGFLAAAAIIVTVAFALMSEPSGQQASPAPLATATAALPPTAAPASTRVPIQAVGKAVDPVFVEKSVEVEKTVVETVMAETVTVNVPDANLAAILREALGKPPGEAITALELSRLTQLNAGESNIADLTGIEYCTNLTELHVGGNPIGDTSPLASLTKLTFLAFDHSWIGDVSPLAPLTSLTSLWLRDNQISDVSPLASLTKLTFLALGGNRIGDISPLTSLTSLDTLWLRDNQIGDVSPLASLTNLRVLMLFGNQISDISPMASLTSLTELTLHDNWIGDISPLASLAKLTLLDLGDNQITDISPLVGNSGLAEGDTVTLYQNPLDFSEGSQNLEDVQTVEARGVAVERY